jgi:adenylate cyclase
MTSAVASSSPAQRLGAISCQRPLRPRGVAPQRRGAGSDTDRRPGAAGRAAPAGIRTGRRKPHSEPDAGSYRNTGPALQTPQAPDLPALTRPAHRRPRRDLLRQRLPGHGRDTRHGYFHNTFISHMFFKRCGLSHHPYKGKAVDAKAIGKDLGVRYVLEGSVLPSANQVRINAQLIDADSGAHLWADQFDTPRADLLQMQDEIVTRLARAMDLQLPEAEAARFKRAQAANPDAEDLALQCAGYTGKDAGSRLCEQALAADPNNVRALTWLAYSKYYSAVHHLGSDDPKVDLERADELVSRALALERNYARAHSVKGAVLYGQGRLDESIAEYERALALDPAMVSAFIGLGWDCLNRGQIEKGLEFLDKAIRLSPHDPGLDNCYNGKAWGYFALKQYDQTIEWARRALAISPRGNPWIHLNLIAALALAGHEAEAHDALQNYLASVPSWPKTIAAWKVAAAPDRYYDGLRKAGLPEE